MFRERIVPSDFQVDGLPSGSQPARHGPSLEFSDPLIPSAWSEVQKSVVTHLPFRARGVFSLFFSER